MERELVAKLEHLEPASMERASMEREPVAKLAQLGHSPNKSARSKRSKRPKLNESEWSQLGLDQM